MRLAFQGFEKKNDYEVWFRIEENEKYSKNGFIYTHIDQSLPPHPEEFEYIVSETAGKKQMKKPLKFSGIAYDFDVAKRILKFKDCELIDFDMLPS